MIRQQPAAPVRVVYVGGPWDGREEALDVPGGPSKTCPVVVSPRGGCVLLAVGHHGHGPRFVTQQGRVRL